MHYRFFAAALCAGLAMPVMATEHERSAEAADTAVQSGEMGNQCLRRDGVAASPEQLNEMVGFLMDFANQMLTQAGEFYPFAAFINAEGSVEAVGGYTGEEQPEPSEVYQLLQQALRTRAQTGGAKAIGIAVNVNIPPAFESPLPDGVRITLEMEGDSRLIYFPYAPAPHGAAEGTPPHFAEPFAVDVPADLFSCGPS
ncbi:MAG: hypothetical protein C0510_03620 [Erythrobacter sp.]|nr:hypothetical protein [Erythrobacter sp.]